MVVADGGIISIEGHVRKYFDRSKGEEVTGIRQAWREVVVDGLG